MLVLKRKLGERLLLLVNGVQIELMVTGIENHRQKAAKIGIEAPNSVMVIRPELLEREREATK
jgi:carbon storage regulator